MHGDVLAGPLWWAAVGVLILAVALALFVVVQSVRPRYQEASERLPEPLWTYTAGQALFLALLFLLQVAALPPIMSGLLVVMIPLAITQAFAFMLRVMWPR